MVRRRIIIRKSEENINVRTSLLILLLKSERLQDGGIQKVRMFQIGSLGEKERIEIKKYDIEQQKFDKGDWLPACKEDEKKL